MHRSESQASHKPRTIETRNIARTRKYNIHIAAMADVPDIEIFIEAIRRHPEIWDVSCEKYDKNQKILAWFLIGKQFYPNIEEMSESERNSISKKLITKWKNIKDAFMRSLRKRNRSGQGVDSGRQYIYYKQLSFLLKTKNATNAGNSIEGGALLTPKTEDESSNSTHNDIINTLNVHNNISNTYSTHDNANSRNTLNEPQNKRRCKETLEQCLINRINTPVTQCTQKNYETQLDEDRAFFDSLLPTVRLFNIHKKLEFRTEVLKLVKNMINTNQIQYTSQYTSQHANTSSQTQVHQSSVPLVRHSTPNSSSSSIVSINSHNECTENLNLDDL